MNTLSTGDILHVRKLGNPVSLIVRLFTKPKSVFTFKWAASHTAICVIENGGTWIYESHLGKGVDKERYDVWAKKNKSHRITEMDATGHRYRIAKAARHFYGYPYEDVLSMWKIPFDKKGRSSEEIFCTELILRIYDMAGMSLCLDPENTSPEELRQYLEGANA